MPAGFLVVYLGVLVLCGWLGWRTQREGWFVAAFAWLLVVGPVCWMVVGAAGS
jgi:biotin transporter BioY